NIHWETVRQTCDVWVESERRADVINVLVEGRVFVERREAPAILLAVVEDAVGSSKYHFVLDLICDANSRAEIELIPRHHILADLAACDGHAGARQEGLLAGRQRVVLILTCTDLELPSAWIIRRNHVALRRGVVIERREQFIAQADVQRQLWRHLPVI